VTRKPAPAVKMDTRIHLITPRIDDANAFRPKLEAVIKASGADSVHLRLTASNEAEIRRFLLVLAPVVQEAGAALLIDVPADLREVARWGVDGVHVAVPEGIEAALEALKPDRIVGAGGLRSKDAAMTAGDDGCDYVMFGEPRADGSLPPLEQVLERCAWWAQLFNTPCIGYASEPEVVAAIAATGVEFVALGAWAFEGDVDANVRRISPLKAMLAS
jgi:thiamine-phosphate pyrophosphorylase